MSKDYYVIVSADSVAALVVNVNEKNKLGYTAVGGPFGTVRLHQAMTLDPAVAMREARVAAATGLTGYTGETHQHRS